MKRYYFVPLKIIITEDEYKEILEKGPEAIIKYGVTGINQAKYLYDLLKNKEGMEVV